LHRYIQYTCYFFLSLPCLKAILDTKKFEIVIQRLAHQLLENNPSLTNTVIIGLQPRGIYLSNRIYEYLSTTLKIKNIEYGKLDITFYRDDYNTNQELMVPNATEINFDIENKKVILIDDVLYTGRTIRCALDAILDFGRPAKVELLVLIDRRFKREFPIQASYTGLSIDSNANEKVKVMWKEKDTEDKVYITTSE
jgi:pyrimidine operon attenuation protein / uracil phosphoribosyltransferase